MRKHLLIAVLAIFVFAGAANAAVIGSITHDYGIGPGKTMPMIGVPLLPDSVIVSDGYGPTTPFDIFDFSIFQYNTITSYTVELTFTGTFSGYGQVPNPVVPGGPPILYPNEFWAVQPGPPVPNETPMGNTLSLTIDTVFTDVMSFTADSGANMPMLFGLGIFDLWFTNLGLDAPLGISDFELYSVTVTALGAVTPIPGAVWLLGSGLIGLVGLRRKFLN